ncbi:MAG: Do family serine endopeptidase [Candidatus Aminicenantes bacterium]|nr:Do family serine endopeptidase [Candidatus Aminicenantes bacterium]
MKKVVWIALASFFIGLLAAGYVLLLMPEKETPGRASFLDEKKPRFNSDLFASPDTPKPDLDFTRVAELVGPAVVKIESERVVRQEGFEFDMNSPFEDFWERFFGQPRSPRQPREFRAQAQGTGFFISSDGFVLTNNHLVENSASVKVTTVQGEDYEAKVKGTDPRTDLALLKVEGRNFPFAEIGDSAQVRVGEWVLAIGNPLGMDHTVTAGIISAKGRQLGVGGNVPQLEDFIQTDAAINRGNSGGPLVNMKGEVIGINSNILTPTGGNIGIGFAIPSNLAKKVVVQLKEKGRVVRGRLGVGIQNIDNGVMETLGLKTKKGALVSTVEAGGPAEKAGLKPYDVIVEVNGQPVENMNDLRLKIADNLPGSRIELTIIREGKEKAVTAVLAELDEEGKKSQAVDPEKDIGLSLTPMTPSLARRHGFRTTEGLLITEVRSYGVAARAGLRQGDIILEVNRKKLSAVSEFESVLNRAESGDPLMLLVRRESEGALQDSIVTLRVP